MYKNILLKNYNSTFWDIIMQSSSYIVDSNINTGAPRGVHSLTQRYTKLKKKLLLN